MPRLGVPPRLPRQPRVDDQPDSRDGQGGFGKGRRHDDPRAAAGFPPGNGAVLLRGADLPVQLQDLRARPAAQPAGHIGHFPCPRDEHQGVEVRAGGECLGVRRGGRVRHMVQEGARHPPFIQPGHRGRHPLHLQRVQRGRTVDDGCRPAAVVVSGVFRLPGVSDQRGEARRVQGGGHGDEREVAAQLADLVEHAEQQVGFESAFVHFVEDDGADGFQSRIGEQAVQQDARRDEFNDGAGAGLAFPADRVPHAVPQPAAVQCSEAPGRRTGCNPARLGDNDARTALPARAPPGVQGEVGQQRRNQSRLAGARRRLHHGGCAGDPGLQHVGQLAKGAAERQAGTDDPQIEGHGSRGRTAGEVTLPLCLQSRGAGFRPELVHGPRALRHRIRGTLVRDL